MPHVYGRQQDCTPGTGCCPYGRLLSKGTTCRKATTECSEEAICDGLSPMCPDNPVKTLGTICRHPGPRSPCEQPATCDVSEQPFQPPQAQVQIQLEDECKCSHHGHF